MVSYHSNYVQVVINMSQVPIELYLSYARMMGGGGDCSLDPFFKIGKVFPKLLVFFSCLLAFIECFSTVCLVCFFFQN